MLHGTRSFSGGDSTIWTLQAQRAARPRQHAFLADVLVPMAAAPAGLGRRKAEPAGSGLRSAGLQGRSEPLDFLVFRLELLFQISRLA